MTRLKTLIPSMFFLHYTDIENVSAAKYIGNTIFDEQRWGKHILDNITER